MFGDTFARRSRVIDETYGAYCELAWATEEITLDTGGGSPPFTDSVANLLPANSVIRSVSTRITTALVHSGSWSVGDATDPDRFSSPNATVALGTTSVGLNHVDQTGTAGPRQSAAAKVRISHDDVPTSGKIRVTVFYDRFVAPTS